MPSGAKANKYMNRHAVEAREREMERTAQANKMRERANEDAMWEEKDAKVLKKQLKQRDAEEKARQQEEVRAERKEQLLREEQELARKTPQKVTRRQIQKDLSKMLNDYDKTRQAEQQPKHKALVDVEKVALPEANPNRAAKDNREENIDASGDVSAALSAMQNGMSDDKSVLDDRHIGRHALVLYRHFCSEHLPALREERPGLRRSQYNDLLWAMWQKSPLNPFVQRSEQFSKERLERERRWVESQMGDNSDEDKKDGEKE